MATVKFDGLPFTVEQWDDAGQRIVETVVAATNGLIARAAFDEAVRARPRAYLTLRHGTRVIARSPQAQSVDGISY
jgi:hypothetical protein